jgi:hypothetical protein
MCVQDRPITPRAFLQYRSPWIGRPSLVGARQRLNRSPGGLLCRPRRRGRCTRRLARCPPPPEPGAPSRDSVFGTGMGATKALPQIAVGDSSKLVFRLGAVRTGLPPQTGAREVRSWTGCRATPQQRPRERPSCRDEDGNPPQPGLRWAGTWDDLQAVAPVPVRERPFPQDHRCSPSGPDGGGPPRTRDSLEAEGCTRRPGTGTRSAGHGSGGRTGGRPRTRTRRSDHQHDVDQKPRHVRRPLWAVGQ